MTRRIPIGTLSVVALAVVVHALPDVALLHYEREAIADGEWWRLFTCHWCHASRSHLFWNASLIAVAGAILEPQSRTQFMLVMVCGAILLGPVLYGSLPEMTRYVGLSGLGAGLVSAVATSGLMRRDRNLWIWVAIAAALSGKILYETFDPSPLLAGSSSHRSVPLAHLLGTLVGIAVTAVAYRKTMASPRTAATSLIRTPVPSSRLTRLKMSPSAPMSDAR